jgi:hypothetical protein
MKKLGQKLSPVLTEIADTVIENLGKKPNYEPTALKDVTHIFMDVVMDKMFDLQENENISLEDSSAMAVQCGEELREFIKKWCNVDTFDYYK